MPERISSAQNQRIKDLKKLERGSERRERNLVLIEGLREVVLALRAGFEIHELYICDEVFTDSTEYSLMPLLDELDANKVFYLSKTAYEGLAYREGTEGVVATAIPMQQTLNNLDLPADALVLVIEAVEKPGNLGAMLRTADAAGVHAVIVCDPATDIFNPNAIRGSIGTVFTVPIAVCNSGEAAEFLKNKGITTYAADLGATETHFAQNLNKSCAFVVGTEATGLSAEWLKAADIHIKIPMLGTIDSLNVSVSAAVLLYEAVRQRSV